MVDFNKIKQLNKQIDKMLKERPEYKLWYKNIRAEMKKAGSRKNRVVMANNIMLEYVLKLKGGMNSLKDSAKEAIELARKLKGDNHVEKRNDLL